MDNLEERVNEPDALERGAFRARWVVFAWIALVWLNWLYHVARIGGAGSSLLTRVKAWLPFLHG